MLLRLVYVHPCSQQMRLSEKNIYRCIITHAYLLRKKEKKNNNFGTQLDDQLDEHGGALDRLLLFVTDDSKTLYLLGFIDESLSDGKLFLTNACPRIVRIVAGSYPQFWWL